MSKNKGNNKRDRDIHHIRPSETPSQGSNQRAYDRRDNDIYGSGGRYGNRDRCGSDRWRSIDMEVIDRVMAVTDRVLVLKGRGLTSISRFEANIMVVLMGHQARGDTRIMSHLPHVTLVGNFIQERRVTRILVLALNVEKLGIWLKIVRKLVRAAGKNDLGAYACILGNKREAGL
uniref:Uncharacterized protein n=1 Tax=Tanacetum cinerariifolium TaxID=118510 RepID=A0A699JGE9_TANCI|nr:hypothetical protein [Tanacetum cinerariifolium]